jgi:hypothetical protein
MPIIVSQSGGPSGCAAVYPTALQVVNSLSTDFQQRIAPEDPIVLDYINRVQLKLLRISRWQFLLSPPQRFITRKDRSDYWIGPAGQGPVDTIDTGLNISNLGPIKTDTVYDRSNFRKLARTKEQLLSGQFAFRDDSSKAQIPRAWRVAPDTPCTFNLYPAPDNQNNFQPQPEAPAVSSVIGGALANRLYFIRTTFVDSLGNESSASDEQRQFIPANNVLLVQPPQEIPTAASGIAYNRYNVYVFNAGSNLNITTGQETLVTQSGPLATNVAYQEPNTGFLTGGAAFPTTNNVEVMGGYLIEFRYVQAKPQVTALSNPLVIPVDYLDVLIAGTNYYLGQFLKEPDAIQYWKAEFDAGVISMTRDKNLFPNQPNYISPDPTSVGPGNYFGYETDTWWQQQGSF